MTKRQRQTLVFLRRWFDAHEEAPSYQEIMAGIGAKSKSRVHDLVYGLRDRGYLTLEQGHARTIRLSDPDHVAREAARRLVRHARPQPGGLVLVRGDDLVSLSRAIGQSPFEGGI